MMQPDLNLWGWLAMPVGVLFCFGPVLIVWALAGFGSEVPEERESNPATDKH